MQDSTLTSSAPSAIEAAEQKVQESSAKFSQALENAEDVIETGSRRVARTVDGINGAIEAPGKLFDAVKQRTGELIEQGAEAAAPAIRHVRRYPKEYAIAAAAGFVGTLFFLWFRRRPQHKRTRPLKA